MYFPTFCYGFTSWHRKLRCMVMFHLFRSAVSFVLILAYHAKYLDELGVYTESAWYYLFLLSFFWHIMHNEQSLQFFSFLSGVALISIRCLSWIICCTICCNLWWCSARMWMFSFLKFLMLRCDIEYFSYHYGSGRNQDKHFFN